jgi:hypothetical protein
MRLAMLDNEQFFLDLLADANRGNASFYPVDPRGLPVFDTPLGPNKMDVIVSPAADRITLKARQDSMYELAANTDGIAVMNNNDLDRGLQRISDDLTSYYLLSYNSTNTRLDGRFRQIRVRVKRPGVEVRARRGYRAATTEEATSARLASEPPAAGGATSAFTAAMESLGRIRPDARLRISAAAYPPAGVIWVAGELQPERGVSDVSLGAAADIEVAGGTASATARVELKPGERTFLTSLKLAATGGDVDVRVRLTPEGGMAFTDAVRLAVGPATAQPLLFRRGPTTANRVVPAADFRFSRTERLRVEVPVAAGTTPGAARLLDKAGSPLSIPVAVTARVDETSGQQWITADVTLAPLAPSDYAIEVTFTSEGGEQRVVTAIRVTR